MIFIGSLTPEEVPLLSCKDGRAYSALILVRLEKVLSEIDSWKRDLLSEEREVLAGLLIAASRRQGNSHHLQKLDALLAMGTARRQVSRDYQWDRPGFTEFQMLLRLVSDHDFST